MGSNKNTLPKKLANVAKKNVAGSILKLNLLLEFKIAIYASKSGFLKTNKDKKTKSDVVKSSKKGTII